MKNFIVALMVLTSLVSCGKNNSVGAVAGVTSVTNPIVLNNTMAQSLVSMIANPSTGFGQGMVSNNTSNQNCGSTLWGLLQYCGSASYGSQTGSQTWNAVVAANPSITYRYSTGRTVRNIDVAIATKQAELTSILNSATSIQVNGSIYYVTVSSTQYVIDTRYPIQLNPSYRADQSGIEYFIQAI